MLVSIIINCHNGAKYLEESLKSIFNQTYKNWEIIFFDNCSTDNSKSIVDRYMRNKNIKYHRSDDFLKLYDARNKAIELSKGDYICFLDTDDTWNKEKLEKQISFLKNNLDCGIVYSNFNIKNELKNKNFLNYKNSLPMGFIKKKLLRKYQVGILTVCFRRNILKKYKFNKNYNIIGDFDLIIRLSKDIKIGSIQEPLANYRIHKENFSTKRSDEHLSELKEWLTKNTGEFDSNVDLLIFKFFLFKLKIKSLLKN